MRRCWTASLYSAQTSTFPWRCGATLTFSVAPLGWSELVELTRWHRDYAREALRIKIVKPRPGRGPMYGPDLLPGLVKCWSVLRAPVRKTPGPNAPGFGADAAVRDKELDLSEQQANLLMQMSTAQIRLGDHLDVWRS